MIYCEQPEKQVKIQKQVKTHVQSFRGVQPSSSFFRISHSRSRILALAESKGADSRLLPCWESLAGKMV